MATADSKQEDSVFQKFCDKNKNDLLNVQAHRIGGEYFVDWEDIKQAFTDIDHLQKFMSWKDNTLNRGVRVPFEFDQYMNM